MADFAPAPIKPLTEVRTLAAIDIRVGTSQAVAEAPGSRKLVKLTVDFGSVSRQILAGLKTETRRAP